VLVGDAAVPPPLSVMVQHKPPGSERHRRLSASCSASSSSHEAVVTASSSKSSSVDMQILQDKDEARPQTLAECKEFIRRLEANSVKQAHEVSFLAV